MKNVFNFIIRHAIWLIPLVLVIWTLGFGSQFAKTIWCAIGLWCLVIGLSSLTLFVYTKLDFVKQIEDTPPPSAAKAEGTDTTTVTIPPNNASGGLVVTSAPPVQNGLWVLIGIIYVGTALIVAAASMLYIAFNPASKPF
jgi:hypothetical protein